MGKRHDARGRTFRHALCTENKSLWHGTKRNHGSHVFCGLPRRVSLKIRTVGRDAVAGSRRAHWQELAHRILDDASKGQLRTKEIREAQETTAAEGVHRSNVPTALHNT